MELNPRMFKKILPKPVTLLTTVDSKGIPNAAPYACVMPILKPLDLIAIASALPRDTLKNIRDTKEFVVNVLGRSDLDKAIKCAKSYPPEVDELKKLNVETISSKKVHPPKVKNALGWFEVTLEVELSTDKYSIIIGKVVFAEINDAYLKDGKLLEFPTILFGSEFRGVGEKIATIEEFFKELPQINF